MFTSKQFSVLIGSIFLISLPSSLSATQTQQILNTSSTLPKAQPIQTQLENLTVKGLSITGLKLESGKEGEVLNNVIKFSFIAVSFNFSI